MEDEKIIAMYLRRDENAISETKVKYHRSLMAVSENILNSLEDSEECVNDTYLGAWQKIPPEKPQFFKAFLCKITRNLSLNRLRFLKAEKRGGSEVSLSLDELSEIIPEESSTIDKVEARELGKYIDAFLRNLKDEERDIFIKRYFSFSSIKEISDFYGYNEGRVKMKLKRTRDKLYHFLNEVELL